MFTMYDPGVLNDAVLEVLIRVVNDPVFGIDPIGPLIDVLAVRVVNAPVFGAMLPIVPGDSHVALSRVDAFPAGSEETVTHAVVFPAATDNTYPTDPRDGAVTIFDPPARIGVNTGATFVLLNVSAELYAGATVFTGYRTPFPSAAGIAPIPP